MPKLRIAALMDISPELYSYLCGRYALTETSSGVVQAESVDFLYLLRDLLTAHAASEIKTSEVAAQLERVATSLDSLVSIMQASQIQSTKPEPKSEQTSGIESLAINRLTNLASAQSQPPKVLLEPPMEAGPPVQSQPIDSGIPEPESSTPPVPKRIDPAKTAARVKRLLGG